MARATLHARVGNPNNLTALPATRPGLTFRTQVFGRGDDVKHTLAVLGAAAASSLLTFPSLALWDENVGSAMTLFVIVFLLFCLRGPLLRPVAVAFVLAMAVSAILGTWRPNALQLSQSAMVVVVGIAYLFRIHYISCCTAGWSRFAPQRHRWGMPTPQAFFDALVLWINYNRHGCRAPGVHQSPAGPYVVRLILTVASVIYLGTALPIVAASSFLQQPPLNLASTCAVGLSFAAPLPVFLLACYIVSAPVLGSCHGSKRAASGEQGLAECWPRVLQHICTSPDKAERESVYLGQVLYDQAPVLVPLEVARKHIWAVGGTGSGKTTFLTSLIEQFGFRGDTSIFVGDLKADTYELLATLDWVHKTVKQRTGRDMPFWKMTNRHGLASHLFSLFHQAEWSRLSPAQKTDVLMAAMSLSYSRSFGESWYSDACYHLLHFVLRKYPDIASFRELAERIAFEIKAAREHELSRSVKQDGEHVRLVLERLASSDAFNYRDSLPEEVTNSDLQLGRLFQEPCLVYGAFSSLLAPTTSPELLRVIISALLTIGTMVTKRTTRVVLVLDEWQRMVAGNLELLLQQARSQGVSIILANQTVADLRQGSIDLSSTVEGNTSVQAWFKDMDKAGMEQIKTFGGLTVDTLVDRSVSVGESVRATVTRKQTLVNRLETNDIAAASSRPDTFLLRITDNRGYAHYDGLPFVARSSYHISEEEYRRRQHYAWPQPTAATILVGQSESASEPVCYPEVAPRPRPSRVVGSGTIGHRPREKGRERKR